MALEDSRLARYTSEFLGTYLLLVTVGCNVLAGNPTWAVTSIACLLMVMVYSVGPSSGANLNPAVSLALGLSRKLPWLEVIIYMVVQLLAAICGAFTYTLIMGKALHLQPSKGFSWWEAGLAEFLYTFMLCFVVLNCVASTKNNPPDNGNQFFGLAIGFSVVAGGYGAGAISGGCFNPAVALGIDISSAGIHISWGLAYCSFELMGAALAAGVFHLVRPDDFGGSKSYDLGVRILSEFIGSFMLVLTVGLNVLGGSPAAAWSIAACLMSMIFSLGNVSGAHLNPAVTIAILAAGRRKCAVFDAVNFIMIQLVGGICAAFTYATMHHGQTFALEPKDPYSLSSALAGEAIFTFVLCFTVLSVATVESPLSQFFGLAIGSCVTAGGYAIGNVSGGSLNPAVSVGISVSRLLSGEFYAPAWNCIAYCVAEIVGALLAAGAFYVTHPSEYTKGFHRFNGKLYGS